MSLLNIANDGFYNVLIVLCRALTLEGPSEKEKLIEICSSKDEKSKVRIRQTLLRWTQLGLFLEDQGVISFATSAAEKKIGRKKLDSIKNHLPSVLREIVFSEENNENFWDAEKSKAADLSRALSWILAQDIYTFSLTDNQICQDIESSQVLDPEKRAIQNDVRLNGLRYWSHYLGFTWRSKTIMIDPTQSIKQECAIIFEKEKEYTASDFLGPLAARIPVIDGGTYRQRVEEALDPQHWRKPAIPEMLSTSLSRALWRLEMAGVIDLIPRSDAGTNRVLQRQNGQELRSFTHVVYRGDVQ